MKVAVIGSGGREHALLRAIHESPLNPECYVWPGNDGMLDRAEKIDVENQDECLDRIEELEIDLCVIGPESYLEDEFSDRCRERGISCWGPDADAACLETSKRFAKEFMGRHGIPTGDFEVAHCAEDIRSMVDTFPMALKFNGLAGGKGVTVAFDEEDVEGYIEEVYEQERFGEPEPVLVEEFLEGVEVTVITAVRDDQYQVYPASRDYKRLNDGDEGPNTGGMGAVSSRQLLTNEMLDRIEDEIIQPTVEGLREEDLSYRGFLYFGLMLTEDGPKILEYNCRFGDPEAQATLPLLEGDFAGYLKEAADGELDPSRISFREDDWSVCVMLASENYPYDYSHGQPIKGLGDVEGSRIYHSATRQTEDGAFEVDGGRIIGVVNVSDTLVKARDRAYGDVGKVHFDGMHHRTDIAQLHFEESPILTQ